MQTLAEQVPTRRIHNIHTYILISPYTDLLNEKNVNMSDKMLLRAKDDEKIGFG